MTRIDPQLAPSEPDPDAAPRSRAGLLIALVMLGATALITHLLGIGVFGYRLIAHGSVDLHVYNGTPHFAHLEIDGATHTLEPKSGRTIGVVGGEVEIETTLQLLSDDGLTLTEQRRPLESRVLNAIADAYLYHVALPDNPCLVAADMTAYYRDTSSRPTLVAEVLHDARLQPLDAGVVIFPKSILPDTTNNPPVVWIATTACELITNNEQPMIAERLHHRAQERRRALREERQAISDHLNNR